jgi:hypothetical protein
MALFSLYDIIPEAIPYPIRSGIVRAVRTAIAAVLAGVSAAILDGSLLDAVQIVPTAYYPAVTMGLTTLFLGIDKWLRERGLVEEAKAEGFLPPHAKEIPAAIKPEVEAAVEETDDQV